MSISPTEILDEPIDSILEGSSRYFYESAALPEMKATLRRAKKLNGVSDVVGQWFQNRKSSHMWTLTFTYSTHRFLIDTNYHAGISLFIVGDRGCENDILLQILNHFDSWFSLEGNGDEQPSVFTKCLTAFFYIFFAVCVFNSLLCFVVADFSTAVALGLLSLVLLWLARSGVPLKSEEKA